GSPEPGLQTVDGWATTSGGQAPVWTPSQTSSGSHWSPEPLRQTVLAATGVKRLQLPSAPLGSHDATPQAVLNAEQSGVGSQGFTRLLVMVQTMSLALLGTETLSVVQFVQLDTGVGVRSHEPAPTMSQAKSVRQ